MLNFPLWLMQLAIVTPVLYLLWKNSTWGTVILYWLVAPVLVVVMFFACLSVFMYASSHMFDVCEQVPLNINDNLTYKDPAMAAEFGNKRIPIETLYEAYFVGKVDIKGDLLDTLYKRQQFCNFKMTPAHLKFLFGKLIPEAGHSVKQDETQVREHYDRGNDFYEAFLGPMMVYTSGIFQGKAEETLEEAQTRKLNVICKKIQLQPNEKVLDLGCGWGTLVRHMSKNYGAIATGCTLAREQKKWADEKIAKDGTAKLASVLCMDYRDVPFQKYHKITCVEMSEHVGVWKYNTFLNQVTRFSLFIWRLVLLSAWLCIPPTPPPPLLVVDACPV